MEQRMGDKLIFAVLQGADYDETVEELTRNGFFITMLSSTGGFLKKKSTTIMIGTSADRVENALEILKNKAGHRQETVYQNVPMSVEQQYPSALPVVPVVREAGGVTVFVLDLGRIEKF